MKMIVTIRYITIILIIAAAGCRVPTHVARPAGISLPVNYHVVPDTGKLAAKPWQQIFLDRYLQALIDSGLNNNLDLQMAMQRIEINRANYRQTQFPLRPAVDGTVNGGVEKLSQNSFNRVNNQGSEPITDIFVGLQSSWELDIWKKLRNRRAAAYARYLASQEAMHLMKTTLVAEIARLYYTLLTLDQELAIIQRNIDLQKSIVDIITIQKEGGRATELAVEQSRAQLLNTQSLGIGYRQQILQRENELSALLGRLPGKIARSTELPATALIARNTFGVPADLLLNRPDLLQAELELKAFEADLEAARAAYFPSVVISGYAGLNALNPLKLFDPSSIAVGLFSGLTGPLFNRINIQSDYQRITAENREAFYNYQKTIINAYSEVMNNLNNIGNIEVQLGLMEEETRTLRNAVDISKDLYLAGYATYLEVIVAQENVLEAELEFINTKNRMYMSGIDLYRSLGGGWR